MDLTSYNLDSVEAPDDLLLCLNGSAEQESNSASELGDCEFVYLQNIYQPDVSAPTPEMLDKKNQVLLDDHGLAAFPCSGDPSGLPNSPMDDSAWASSISTPDHQSPVRLDDFSASAPAVVELSKEKKERKRKADAKDSGEESSVHSGSVGSPADQENDEDFSTIRLKPEDDPFGLFTRDPHSLTPDELKLLKKQKRLIKNRESAQLSRHRKKLHQETLETQVLNLEKEKHMLNARLEQLALENAILKKQLLCQGKIPMSAPMPNGMFESLKPTKGSVVLAVMFASALFFTNVDTYQNETNLSQSLAPIPISNGAVLAAPYSGSRGRVLLSTGLNDDIRPSEPLVADKKQLLIITLLDHLVIQLKAPSSLFLRLCVRLTQMGVLDGCDFVDSMAAVRQEYLEVFRAFNNEFPQGESKVANAHFDAEFVFARKPPSPLPKQIDPAPFAVPLPPTVPNLGVRDGAADEDNARLLQRIRGQLSGDVNLLCPSAQLLISDVPANPESRSGVGARLTRLQRVVAARVGNGTGEDRADAPRGDAAGGEAGNETAGELPVSVGVGHGGALSMVLPRRIFDSTRISGRLPAVETSLLELRCSAYDLNPLGFPSLVGA